MDFINAVSDSLGQDEIWKFCISNKFPGELMLLVYKLHLEQQDLRGLNNLLLCNRLILSGAKLKLS